MPAGEFSVNLGLIGFAVEIPSEEKNCWKNLEGFDGSSGSVALLILFRNERASMKNTMTLFSKDFLVVRVPVK